MMLIHATEEEMRFIETELLHHKQSGGILEVEVIPDDEDSQKSPGYEATTLLHLAAKYGNKKATQYLIDKEYHVDIPNPSGCTPLMLAIHFEENEVVQILLDADADIFLSNYAGLIPAKLSFQKSGNIAFMVLKKIKSICGNDSQATAKKLLEIDCSLALATFLEDASIVNYMLDNGRVADEPDPHNFNRTALHYVVYSANKDIVNLLLDRGIDVNVTDNRGRTPLFDYNVTAKDNNEKLEVLKILLDRGASLTTLGCFSTVTALQYLSVAGKKDTVKILVDYNKSLIEAGRDADVNSDIIEILQSENWNFNELDQFKTLSHAAIQGNVKIFEFLLRKGVNPNSASEGYPIMMMLSKKVKSENQNKAQIQNKSFLKCVELLLCHGGDAQFVMLEEIAIFDIILEEKNFALAKIIIAHLALTEELGHPIKESIIDKINMDVRFKKYFDLCKQRLDKMTRTVIYKQVTLFKFLSESDKQLVRYARNQDLMAKLKSFMYHKRNSTMYYDNVIRRRLRYGELMARLKDNAIAVLLEIPELKKNELIAHTVVEYLDYFNLLRFS